MIRRRVAPLLAVLLLGLVMASSAQAAGGTAMAWGYNGSGNLGNGTEGSELPCDCVPIPGSVAGLSGVTQIDGAYEHALALRDDGTVWAWGYNDKGQLGDGTTTDRPNAAPVPGLSNVVAVSAASEFSLALLADGTMRAWGANASGVFGNGSTLGPEGCPVAACSKVPVPVPGVSNVIAISAGYEFVLALRADGTVLAWGANRYGALGDGVGTVSECDCIPTPTQIAGLSRVVAISAGSISASALLADGTVRIWGYNDEGNLGTGFESPSPPCYCLPPTSPTGVAGVRQIASGDDHILALLSSGAVQAWGTNEEGELGLGFFSPTGCECVTVPATIPGLTAEALTAGHEHSMALLSSGTGLSWGDGYYGELGNGKPGDKMEVATPAPVSALAGASELDASYGSSYAITGPKQTLSVAFAGAGTGRVGGDNIICPPSCTAPKPQGQVEALRAEPDPGTAFAGFTGPCTGTGACQVKMTGDQTVTATFGPPKGTAITSATIKGKKKKKATFTFSAPGVVIGYECKLTKPKPKRKKKAKAKAAHGSAKKGKLPKAKFAPCATPMTYKNLRPGRYTFEARALNALGIDAVPAKRAFKVRKAKAKKKR